MTHKEIIQALAIVRPGSLWNLRGSDLEWNDPIQSCPTREELEAALEKK